jgi:hypothetical protein
VDKTIIGAKTVQYLGYTLLGQGVTLSKDKLAAMKDFPMPTSPRPSELLQVTHSEVLTDGGPTEQDDQSLNGMEDGCTATARSAGGVQQAQGSIDVSTHRSERQQGGQVHTPNRRVDGNAAGGMGAVRLQEQKDKTERVVTYASRGLKDHEVNYPAFLLEKAAACWGIDYFDTYLTTPKQFTLCTDHRPLGTMSTIHKKTLNNLQLLMLKFNFVIEYKEGWRNTVADALSRTHAAAPICVIARSGRRMAEDNSVPAYRRAEEDKEEEQDPALEDDGEIPSQAIVARTPQATPRRDLKSTIGVNLQKEQDKDKRTKMVKEYLTNSVLPRDRAKADWVVTMSNHCILVDGVLWYKIKTKTRITMAVWAPLSLRQLIMEAAHASRDGGHRGETKTIDRVRL